MSDPEQIIPLKDPSPRKSRRVLKRTMTTLAVGLGAGIAGGSWRILGFVQHELSPLIAKEVSGTLNRPFRLGDVKQVSFNSLEFGPSQIPPHPYPQGKPGTDQDSATVKAVRVNFDPVRVLMTRTLNLEITLVEPKAYINQTENGQWLESQITLKDEEEWLKTQLDRVKIEQGQVTLAPFQAEARRVENLNGAITLKNKTDKINLNITGDLDSGGQTQLQGQWLQPSQNLTLQAKMKKLELAPLLRFVPSNFPLTLYSGQLDGAFKVAYQPQKPLQVQAKAEIKNGNVQLKDPAVQVAAQQINTDLKISYTPNQLPIISGKVKVQDSKAKIPEDLVLKTGRSRFLQVQKVNGSVDFLEKSKRVRYDFAGDLLAGGRFQVEGVTAFNLSETNVVLRANAVPASLMDRAYQFPIQVDKGTVNTNLLIRLRQDELPFLKGWAQLRNVNASMAQMPQAFSRANGDIQIEGLTANLNQVRAFYGQVPLVARGRIDPDRGYDLSVQVQPTDLSTALKTLQVESLPIPLAGRVEVPNLRVTGGITTPVLTGTVQTRGKTTLDRVPFRTIAADFRLGLPDLEIQNILIEPTDGGQVTGSASYRITPGSEILATLQATGIPGDAIAQRYGASSALKIGAIAAQVKVTGQPTAPVTLVGFQAPQAIYATQGQLVVSPGEARLRNVVSQVAGGTVLTEGLLREGQLTAQVQPRGLVLKTFSPDLRGMLSGSFAIAAPLANLSAQTLRANGNLRFSEGLSLIDAPIDSAIAWNGQQIVLREASAPGFNARGLIGTDLDHPAGPRLTVLDLAFALQKFPLSALTALGPTKVELGGTTDLTGQVSGTVTSPRLNASLALNQLAVAQVPFESRLAGQLTYNPQGVDLNLVGNRDRIQVNLASDFLPNRFLVRRDDAIAQGQRRGDTLMANFAQFPIQILNLRPAQDFGLGPIAGIANGNVNANLKTYASTGNFSVQQPRLGTLVGDRVTGQFQYRPGVAQLIGTELHKRESRYRLDATVNLDEDPDVIGSLSIAQGQIGDVLYLAQGFGGNSPAEFGSAKDLELAAVGEPDAPIFVQLQRLAEVKRILALEAEKRQQAPPSLADLTGTFNGQIALRGSAKQGVQGNFDLLGTDFQWGDYGLETAVVKGSLLKGGVNFAPLRLASGNRVAQYTGSLALDQQSGQLVLSQVPIDALNDWATLSVPITGQVNSVVNIGGSLTAPTVQGDLNLVQGQVNNTIIQEAKANFSYEEARFRVEGLARFDNPEPVTLSANIPYALPFGPQDYGNDQIAVDVKVKDQGLGLLSLFTDQVAWLDGKGLVDLKIRGTLTQPVVNGLIALQDATLTTPSIENPVTAVNGSIQFDQNLVQIPQLVGTYEPGNIRVTGSLPITNSNYGNDGNDAENKNLQVDLNDLDLKLKNLYKGGITGTLLVNGSVLQPRIGGKVLVQQGKVVLTDVAAAGNGASTSALVSRAGSASLADNSSPITFDRLQVTLGDRVRISQPPVLSFIAAGDLTVNGDLNNPRPEGKIHFQKGTINLFTSRFRIDPSRDNVAIFDPRNGLDPYLDIGMRSSVVEAVQGRTNELSEFATVSASSLGRVESVRVYAKVDGLASQLQTNFSDVVDISSDPRRSQQEIIGLLGGGVTESLQEGEFQTAALNVASSALLGNVQDLVNDALGSRVTVNAFPVLLPIDDANTSDASVLSFGAEVNYDVTDRFSVSALQILTGATQPTLFNLKYQLSNALRARASIGNNGDAVGLLEYRIRF